MSVSSPLRTAAAPQFDPSLLADVRVESIEDLAEVRALALRLAAPATDDVGEDTSGWFGSLWREYVSDPLLGADWLRSRVFQEDFLYSVLNKAFLAGRIRQLLTSSVKTPLWLPGRFSRYDADLELKAEIVHATRGLSTDDVMTKRSDGTTQTEDVSTDVTRATLLQGWMNLDWGVHQLPRI